MKYTLGLLVTICAFQLRSQDLLQFSLQTDQVNCPIQVPLENLNYNTDQQGLALFEEVKGQMVSIPCQLEKGHGAKLWFILPDRGEAGKKRSFVIRNSEALSDAPQIVLQRDHEDLDFTFNDKPILSYRFATTQVPDGVDPLFQRSGYIHPVTSPAGEVLTRIQPPDHYHHYGIWGPWTKTHRGEREIDFWNLLKGHGTVKFAGFLSQVNGAVYTGFKALQQHMDFGGNGPDEIAINEILDVRAWNVGDKYWLIDYTINLNSPLEDGILFDAYRYGGGVGFRATEKWHKDNCTILTSEGKDRKDADGSNARWCRVEGESAVDEGRSGILFMSHPSNRMHPEPMRVWPLDGNGGRGDMFFEFCPIRHESWTIEPGRDYVLKYRLLAFDGEVSAEESETHWQAFQNPPIIEIE